MIETKLHKWFFSLTLLFSLVSFSGIAQDQVKSVHAITVVIYQNNVASSAFHISLSKHSLVQKPVSYYEFNFNSFIQTQNGLYFQKIKAQNVITFIINDGFITSRLKQFSDVYTEDYLSYIG